MSLFSLVDVRLELLAALGVVVISLAIASRKLVFDIFRNDSPAQSPKRPVPWSPETAFVLFICGALLFPIGAAYATSKLPRNWFPDFAATATPESADVSTDADKTQKEEQDKALSTQHPLARLLIRSQSTPWRTSTFFLCLFVAVFAAPFAEEFLYRTLFQGTLENIALQAVLPPPNAPRRLGASDVGATAAENANENADAPPFENNLFRWTDPLTPMERRSFRLRSFLAIFIPALMFGLVHAGAPETSEEASSPETLNSLYRTMVAAGCANVATLILGFFFLRGFSGATTGDVGLGPEFTYKAGLAAASLKRFALDFYRGIVAFIFIAPIIFIVNGTLRYWAPNTIVDPIPIFVFALAEGIVYWRTRRYATVVGMHVALNTTSFLTLCCNL